MTMHHYVPQVSVPSIVPQHTYLQEYSSFYVENHAYQPLGIVSYNPPINAYHPAYLGNKLFFK